MQALLPTIAVILIAAQPAGKALAQARVPQPLPPGTSALRGTLTDALTKAPVAGCEVRAALTAEVRANSVTTGADGSFEFAGIPEGAYFLRIQCPSYLTDCVKSGDVGTGPCTSITLFRDQQRSGLDFRLMPGAIARGRVMTGAGTPVAKATVRLGRPSDDRPFTVTQPATTKDDGTFELPNLPDGAWPLEVDIPVTSGARPPIIYYPGVMNRDEAGTVELIAGRVNDNITITLPPVLESTLTVRVPPPDATMPSVTVSIVRAEPLMTRRLQLDADGRATITGLVAGRYFLTATGLAEQEAWVAYQALDFVEGSIDVSLNLQPGGRIRGRIINDRDGLPPMGDAIVGAVWVEEGVTLNPMTPEEAQVAADGTFEIGGVFGRRKLQLIRFDPVWLIQSVRHGRSDVTTTGVDVAPGSVAEVTVVVRRR